MFNTASLFHTFLSREEDGDKGEASTAICKRPKMQPQTPFPDMFHSEITFIAAPMKFGTASVSSASYMSEGTKRPYQSLYSLQGLVLTLCNAKPQCCRFVKIASRALVSLDASNTPVSTLTLADTLFRPHFLSLLQHHYILLQRRCPRSHFYLGIPYCPCRPFCYTAADIYIYMDGKDEATMP